MKGLYFLLSFFIFILFLNFTVAEYLIYEQNLDELIKSVNADCSSYKEGGITLGTTIEICEETSYCKANYIICENEKRVDKLENKNCVPCKYGCYKKGCYNSKIKCDDLSNCEIKEGEIYSDDYVTFGFVTLDIREGWEWHKLNVNNEIISIVPNQRTNLRTKESVDKSYYFTLLKTSKNSAFFSLEIEEKGCVVDSDCEDIINFICRGKELQEHVFPHYCDSENKCIVHNPYIREKVPCEYKCENNSCVECNGCIINEGCFEFGILNETHFCDKSKRVLSIKNPKESCVEDYECSLEECINNKCKDYRFFQKIKLWFWGLFKK